MNIFIYDKDIKKNAQYHPDKHVVKMQLELAQMLSTVYSELTGEYNNLYKPTHSNHPCTLWVKESYANFKYAIDLFYALHDEWNYRYQHNKIHKSFEVINIIENINPSVFPKQGITKFAQAMPNIYKDINPVKAYRDYFNGEKLHLAKWKNREVPHWILTNNKIMYKDVKYV